MLFQTYQRIIEELRAIYQQQQQFELYWKGNLERAAEARAAAAGAAPGRASAAPGTKAPAAGTRYKNPAAIAAMAKENSCVLNEIIELNDE